MSPSESALLKGSWAGVEDMAYCREIRTAEAALGSVRYFQRQRLRGVGSVSEAVLRTKDS